MFAVIYLGLVMSHVATAQQCGQVKIPPPAKFITDGNDSPAGAFPWTLDLLMAANGSTTSYCGAVLIDYYWALTSAQCVDEMDISLITVVAGRVDSSVPTYEQYIDVANVTVHPDFDPMNESLPGDLAILGLAQPANIDDPDAPINSICLPPSPDTRYWENPNCAMSGFGVNENGVRSDIMQQAWIDVIRPINCELYYEPDGVPFLRPEHQCTFDQVNRDVALCEGDPGIPLSCIINGVFDLAGTGSFSRNCNGLLPSIFTSTPVFLDWIIENTGIPRRS